MANPKHLKLLRQGVNAWNNWRDENLSIEPDLKGEPKLDFPLDLRKMNLQYADLRHLNLTFAMINGANLRGAMLMHSLFLSASLSDADLSDTELPFTIFQGTIVQNTDFTNATMGGTIFVGVDLSSAKGLETVRHNGPSHIDIDTLYQSKGNIPVAFLRGAGIPETLIDYLPSLTAQRAWEFYTCFISYSSKDEAFARKLYDDLQLEGVRCWFAPEDMKIGDKIRSAIDNAISIRDKLLLILTEHSIKSPWVEKEVETAFEEENKRKQIVLFPIRLDDTVMVANEAWAADIRRTRHIGDFRQWRNHESYQKSFERLLQDLNTENIMLRT